MTQEDIKKAQRAMRDAIASLKELATSEELMGIVQAEAAATVALSQLATAETMERPLEGTPLVVYGPVCHELGRKQWRIRYEDCISNISEEMSETLRRGGARYVDK